MKPLYVPKDKAKEYGDYAVNIYTGCPHRCYYTMDIYVMVFNALKEAEKKRIAEKRKNGRSQSMKITLDIPDGMRCICISGVREKDRELLLVSSTVGSDNLYDGAECKVLWGKTDET